MMRASALGRGSAPAAPSNAQTTATVRPKAIRPARVLVAEDNEVNQLVASEILIKAGFLCEVVPDGSEAVRAVREGNFDLVLMDCHMPVIDGFNATMQIRQWELEAGWRGKPYRRLPIIALTANALKSDRDECIAAGMDDFVRRQSSQPCG